MPSGIVFQEGKCKNLPMSINMFDHTKAGISPNL